MRFSFIVISELVNEYALVSELEVWSCESELDFRLVNSIFGRAKIFPSRSKKLSGSVEQSEIFFRVKLDFSEVTKIENFVLGRGLVILFPNWKINSVKGLVPTFEEKVGLKRETL